MAFFIFGNIKNNPYLDLRPRRFPMNRLLAMSEALLRTGVILVPIACLAGAFLMTAGTDETWILFGVRGLVEHGQYAAESPFNSVQSTGGLHTVLAALLHLIGDGRIEIIRILSVLSIAALLFTLRQWALRFNIKSPYCWLVTAAPLLAPGTLMFGAQAYGTVLAFLLVTVGLMSWSELEPGSWRRRLLTGILIGTAAATRPDCAFALFAPLAAVLLTRSNRTHLLDSTLVLIIGGLVFLLQAYLLWLLSVNLLWKPESYGVGNPFSIPFGYLVPRRLAFWSIGQSFMPFAVAVLTSIGWFHTRVGVNKPFGIDALLAFGWLAMLAWLFQAPIPHLRYFWPALAAFSVVAMFALALLFQAHARHAGYVLALGIALLAMGYLDGARSFLHGESDILSWQLSRETQYSLQYGPFRHLQYQRAMVNRLQQIPPGEPIATIGFNTALSFLTRRPVVPVQAYYPEEGKESVIFWRPASTIPPVRPRWIVSTPMVNHYPNSYMSHHLYEWLKANCRVADRQGPYVLYEVIGAFPDDPEVFSLDRWGPNLP